MAIIKPFKIKSFKKNDPSIEFKNVSLGFGNRLILNNINFSINKNTIHGLLGPNGAGKSTLVKSMFGLVEVRSGTVLLLGEEITNLAAHELVRKGVGYVPQTENVFPSLTVSENLQMGAYQLKANEINERIKFYSKN